MADAPKLSVVLAVDHEHILGRTVAALAAQTLPPDDYEVLVVDCHRARPWEPVIAEAVAGSGRRLNVRLHTVEGGGRARAQNVGIRHARADLVVSTVDDFIPVPGFLEAHLRFHAEHPEPHVVGIGPTRFPPALRTRPFARWIEDSGDLMGVCFTSASPSVPPHFFYAGNASLKRAFVERAGFFDEAFPYDGWEDYELSLRLAEHGMHAMYVPDAETVHEHEFGLRERRRSMRQAGESAVLIERKRPGPQPWHARCRIPPSRHTAVGLAAGAIYLVTRKAEWRERYYWRMVTAAFVSGYRAARRASAVPTTARQR